MATRDVTGWLPNLIGPVDLQVNGEAASVPKRQTINLLGVASVTDNPDQDRTDLQLGGLVVEDDSGDPEEFPQRSFVQFKGATVTDDPGNSRTIVNVTPPTYSTYTNRIVADVDLSALPNQTISGNGNFTLGGITWTMENYAKATSVALVNGAGLRITCNSTSGDYVYNVVRSAALVHAKVADLLPGWSLHQMLRTRVWVYMSHNAGADYEFAKFGFEGNASPQVTQAVAGIGHNSALSWGFLQDDPNNTTDNVGILEWYGDPLRFALRSGAYSSGWPDIENTNEHFSGDAMLAGSSASVKAGWKNTSNVDFTFVAQTANTAGTFVATLKRIKIEAW